MARVLALVPDLMLASRVDGALRNAGHEVRLGGAEPEGAGFDADLVVCDLEAVEPEAALGQGVPVIGFYSHVDVETRRKAESAGLDLVIPRSRMARELPELVEDLLSG